VQVDLGSALAISRIVLKLPPSWGARTQTLSVTDGATGETLVPNGGRLFDPATGNTVTLTFPQTTRRFVRVNFTANTGWPAGQLCELEVYAG
ncbi:MAG TPA: discoidin domain-containing protein, partial [Candidatus Limnocylindrales bacterium]|nr:discoidin domain-containing protein [Candidatus Limnocylindrales bacterium]